LRRRVPSVLSGDPVGLWRSKPMTKSFAEANHL
jgi:hypothetical protein